MGLVVIVLFGGFILLIFFVLPAVWSLVRASLNGGSARAGGGAGGA